MNLAQRLLKKALWTLEAIQVNGSALAMLAGDRVNQRAELGMRYWSWRKLLNILRIEVQLRLGWTTVGGRPFEWEIDTTNICQLQCPLCHTGLGTVNRDKGFMHFDTYARVIDQIEHSCVWLSLYSWGEPFLNPQIDRFIAYAHEKRIATLVSSNLNKPLTPEMAERLVRSGLDVLIISLDGITQDVYQVYRVNGHLDRVLDNIRLLVQKRAELGSTTPLLEWQFIVMRHNEHQVEEARRMAGALGIDLFTPKRVDFPHGEDDLELARRWLPAAELEARMADPFRKPYSEEGTRCHRLWRSGVVNWDGGYAPCCYLTDAADDFGDASRQPVKEIWNNDHYREARSLFKKGYTPTMYVGCLDCSVYQRSPAGRARGPAVVAKTNGAGPRRAVPVPAEVAVRGTNGATGVAGRNGAASRRGAARRTKERSAPGSRPSPHIRPRLTLREPQGERLGERQQ